MDDKKKEQIIEELVKPKEFKKKRRIDPEECYEIPPPDDGD